MSDLAFKVNAIFSDCLFKPEELEGLKDGEVPEGSIIIEGIMATFGFHPDRVKNNEKNILDIINEMKPQFFKDTGGGWTFLNLCMDKNDSQWGEHPDCERLMVLAMAIGKCRYLFPKEMAGMLPGGMPYITFIK